MKPVALFTFLLAIPATAVAAADSSSQELLAGGMRVLGALVLVIGLVLVIFALVRRRFRLLPGQRQGQIEVIEMRYLAPKKAVALVRVRDQELVLGMGGEQISLLHRMERGGAFEAALDRSLEEQVQ